MELKALQSIFRVLNEADARYLVVGGLAVVLHGHGRLTVDVDLVLDLSSENILRSLRALEGLGYRPRVPVTAEEFADADTREGWVRDKGMTVLNLHSDLHPGSPVDLFVTEPFPFERVYARSHAESLEEGIHFRFVDVDTLLEMKRKANRPKDRLDIEQLERIREMERE